MGLRKQIIHQTSSKLVMMFLAACCYLSGCSSTPVNYNAVQEDCIGETSRRVREAPQKEYLYTLDGQYVRLKEFFDQCKEKWPDCNLFPKFYYWKNEVKQVVSQTDKGYVDHKIRVYYDPLSICYPERVNPARTHGDVAEFYSTEGVFMGLAVYMGQGQYFLLNYSGYKKLKTEP